MANVWQVADKARLSRQNKMQIYADLCRRRQITDWRRWSATRKEMLFKAEHFKNRSLCYTAVIINLKPLVIALSPSCNDCK